MLLQLLLLHCNLLFRWFACLGPDDPLWHPNTVTKNRDRLLNEELMERFLNKLMAASEFHPAPCSAMSTSRMTKPCCRPGPPMPRPKGSMVRSIHRRRRQALVRIFGQSKARKKRAKADCRDVKLSNQTHRSCTDPDALLCRNSNAHRTQPSCPWHVLMDNRHALIVDCQERRATGTSERDAAQQMAADLLGAQKKTLGADKHYDSRGMVAKVRRIGIIPHVTQNTSRPGGSAIDGSNYAPRGLRAIDQCPKRHGQGL